MCGEANENDHQVETSSVDREMDGSSSSNNTPHDQQDTPIYVLSRNLTTVHEVWKEWDKGLRRGDPAVKDLEAKYKAKWRDSEKERKFFSKRKIIDEIYGIHEKDHVSITEAVNRLEARRGKRSLDRLWKDLNQQNKRSRDDNR
ncbi:predicted protein [Lichtheimia corymbifera JMRC:FSU:9682]|uniref:Transcription activator GCR1-like domain-containing protein n=1 Tax=Lichtheimia corymbifera JMRC:FSU:9682 TaxID=1263082 RepID=A0A068SCW4_9FUNG|nr:predicted protein [Lichtheimia corymbifera JMRC:FSU:9682]